MPVTQFNDPLIVDDGLLVSGPLQFYEGERAQVINDIQIRFLIVRDEEVARAEVTVIDELAVWRHDEEETWAHLVPAKKAKGFDKGVDVRCIGLMIVLKKPKADVHHPPLTPTEEEPPYFETLSWCVEKKVVTQ